MLRTGNDLQFQLLGESDFGSVITVQSHTFKDGEEIALHLSIAAFGFPEWRAVFFAGAGNGGGPLPWAGGGGAAGGGGGGGGVWGERGASFFARRRGGGEKGGGIF